MNFLTKLLISETGTLGVRIRTSERITMPRSVKNISIEIENKKFNVHYKTNEESNKFKIEAEDIKSISDSLNKSFRETEELIRSEINKKLMNS